jgi:hypothetical protein
MYFQNEATKALLIVEPKHRIYCKKKRAARCELPCDQENNYNKLGTTGHARIVSDYIEKYFRIISVSIKNGRFVSFSEYNQVVDEAARRIYKAVTGRACPESVKVW